MKPLNKLFQVSLIIFASLHLIPKNAECQNSYDNTDTVPIGLLVQTAKSSAAHNGADLAIKEANAAGGFNGRPFVLVARSLEGPWGTGSKEAVSLIFDKKVWALIGSHDGRNAHLVEQVATKSKVVMLSAWAGDPTLSQAFVPWFYNCIPNDNQQAEALIEGILKNENSLSTAVISDESYDSGSSLRSFLQVVKTKGLPLPVEISWENAGSDAENILELIQKSKINSIVLFCQPSTSMKIIKMIHNKNLKLTVFGSLSILNEDELSENDLSELEKTVYVASENWDETKFSAFRQKYLSSYGSMPGTVAAYSFDCTNILIRAIRNAGSPEREKIQKCLKNINYEGVTGPVHFDERGNRFDNYNVMCVEKGVPITGKTK